MSTRILCRIDHTLCYLIMLLFWLKSRFDTADPRLLIQSSLKTRLLLRESFDFLPSVAQRHIPIGVSEVAPRLRLIWLPFARPDAPTSSLHVFKYQPTALASNTSPLTTVPLLFSAYRSPVAIFPSPFHRSNHLSWSAKTTGASARWRKFQKGICR